MYTARLSACQGAGPFSFSALIHSSHALHFLTSFGSPSAIQVYFPFPRQAFPDGTPFFVPYTRSNIRKQFPGNCRLYLAPVKLIYLNASTLFKNSRVKIWQGLYDCFFVIRQVVPP